MGSPREPSRSPLTVLPGDCRETLKTLPDNSVHCVVTSPPYWGLRDYGNAAQIGLESTPEEYIAQMVAVFREVKRILREDGTCWINIGDSYAGGGNGGGGSFANDGPRMTRLIGTDKNVPGRKGDRGVVSGLKPKDLVGIPWMLAFALRADGWWLRSEVIWQKPNPMPESVTDRPTKAHEQIFLLTKSARYFYDAEAIKEAASENTNPRNSFAEMARIAAARSGGANTSTGKGSDRKTVNDGMVKMNGSFQNAVCMPVSARNKRSVWTVVTAPYSGAHFATFPPALIAPMILAGTSARGCCAQCGAPWARMVEAGAADLEHQRACGGDANGEYHGTSTKGHDAAGVQDASAVKARILAGMRERKTVGWAPGCNCFAKVDGSEVLHPVPCTVLDPFLGSGTTAQVALELGRHAIGCELSAEYHSLIAERTAVTLGLAL